jgi:hypothetical protein
MKQLTDYRFYDSWQLDELGLKPGETYRVGTDVGDLKQGQSVTFAGFDDVDNHYGIFVFVSGDGAVLEVSGDCSGRDHTCLKNLRAALSPGQAHPTRGSD